MDRQFIPWLLMIAVVAACSSVDPGEVEPLDETPAAEALNTESDPDVEAAESSGTEEPAPVERARHEPLPPIPADAPVAPEIDIEKELADQDSKLRTGVGAVVVDGYRDRLTKHPRSAALWYLYGRVLGRVDQLEDAKGAFDRALALDPELAWAYHGRGFFHAKKQMHESAIADLEKALELDPERARFMSALACQYHDVGKHARGVALIRKAIAAEPKTVAHRLAYAMMLVAAKERDLAIVELNKALEIAPSSFNAYMLLSKLYLRDGNPKAALAVYDRLLTRIKDPSERAVAQQRIAVIKVMQEKRLLEAIPRVLTLEKLEEHLKSDNVKVRRKAYELLATWDRKGNLPWLQRGLMNEDSAVRVFSVLGLVTLDQKDHVPDLLRLLRLDRDERVRGAVVDAISELARPTVVPDLIEMFRREKSQYVLEQLLDAMRQLAKGGPDVEMNWDEVETSRVTVADAWDAWWKKNRK